MRSVEEVAEALGVEAEDVEHLRLHHWYLWQALKVIYLREEVGPVLLTLWRDAPRGSQER